MKTLVSFRTNEENKIKLIEKAERLGITISDLMDSLLTKDVTDFRSYDEHKMLINHFQKSVFFRRRVFLAYKLAAGIESKMKKTVDSRKEVKELIQLISDTYTDQYRYEV